MCVVCVCVVGGAGPADSLNRRSSQYPISKLRLIKRAANLRCKHLLMPPGRHFIALVLGTFHTAPYQTLAENRETAHRRIPSRNHHERATALMRRFTPVLPVGDVRSFHRSASEARGSLQVPARQVAPIG